MKFTEKTLNNWSYRKFGSQAWKPARNGFLATEIHPDLVHNGEIPDPFIDDNEKQVQWVGETDWEYKATFTVDSNATKAAFHQLIFEGLDTFTDVYLNDKKVLTTDNMFIEYKANVNDSVKLEGENELRIVFKSALLIGRELERVKGFHHGSNGETSRVQIRKAQYHYGWDWGPLLMTCGPYRPVKFQSFDSKMGDVFVDVEVDEKLSVNVDVKTEIETDSGSDSVVTVEVISPQGETVHTISTKAKNGLNSQKFSIKDPELWYPFSHGNPSLYTFKVNLIENDNLVHNWSHKVGLRRVELVQEPLIDQPGTSFYFKVNNIPVYSSGSDWIPSHSFQTSQSDDDYKQWMKLMIDGNQNLLRIWGGGYFERDILYQECDRLGILIWHDLMFACGQYPGYKQFLDSVSEEIISQLKRLRNYCSLALFAGNNEDYQIAERLKLTWDKEDTRGDYSTTNFPARTLYEGIFPKLIKEYFKSVPYHPGSPWGGVDTDDPTVGDIHQWNVWHGRQEKYQDWYKLGGRFVSEFGMEALPCRKTYEDCITDKRQLYPQSYMVDHHNKSKGFERRLALYVIENIQVQGLDLDSWIYATQLMQAECLGYAYRCWRREWRGDGKRYLGGAAVWQINDCWPCASWAIVDFYKRPKLAYYSVKRESKPLGVGIYRNEHKKPDKILDNPVSNSPPFDYREVTYTVDIWGVNSGIDDKEAVLKVTIFNTTSGEEIDALPDKEVVLKANQTTEFYESVSLTNKVPAVLYARVVSKEDNSIIASAGDWPQPLKYLDLRDREVNVKVEDDRVILSANKPVKGVEIMLEKELYVEDNGFDIFPGDEKVVEVKGLKKGDEVKLEYYQRGN